MTRSNELNVCDYAEGRLGAWDSRFALKGSKAMYLPDRTFDTEHIRLEIDIDFQKQILRGRCRTTLRAITDKSKEMVFDAVNFEIQEVRWGERKVAFTYRDGKLKVNSPQAVKEDDRVEVEIRYRVVKPQLGAYFIRPNRHYPDRPIQMWTQGEDEYARYWFPCHDAPHDRVTSEVIASVPRGFTAISNGRLVKESRDKKTKKSVFHWLQTIPHATYLVTLAAGRFREIKDHWKKIPVTYYCEKGREEDTKRAFGKTPKMMEFFSTFIGTAYPYEKYAQVAAAEFIYGGMENTSATTQTDTALLDERATLDYTSDELVAHELAHQWFGDYLTCKEWPHAWLNESFATYFDALFKRSDKGEDEFLYAIHNNSEAYFQEDKDHYRRPIVTKVFKRPTDLFDRHLYEKGSVVLYMMHRILGEDLFRKAIGLYVRRHKGTVVETTDLINAIEDATGRNMRRFFDQWVYGGGHPELRLRYWWDEKKKEANIRVVQTHGTNPETGLFWIPTNFLFVTKKGEKRTPVVIENKSHLFKFKLESEPQMVLFDPDHAVLKRVDFPRSEAMLVYQLKRDKNVLGRIEAAQLLSRKGTASALAALRQALYVETFWAVQSEIAAAIGRFNSEASSELLINALGEIKHPKVRRAVYAALKNFKSQAAADEIESRIKSEKSYFAQGEALKSFGALNPSNAGEVLKEALEIDSWNDIIRIYALEGLAATRSTEWLPLMLASTKEGKSQRLRMAAIRSLPALDGDPTEIQNRLIELTNDPFLLVQITAVRALHQIGDERAVPALKNLTTGDRDGRLKRLAEEAVERITKGFE